MDADREARRPGGTHPSTGTHGCCETPATSERSRTPPRMAIIDALASGDELTATECAEITGLSPSATAYHLRALERHGFAEPAPARRDGRQRPWRATDRGSGVELDASTPAGAAATAAVGLAFIEQSRAIAADFIAHGHEESAEWQDAAVLGNADVWLTLEEISELNVALAGALEPYRAFPAPPAPRCRSTPTCSAGPPSCTASPSSVAPTARPTRSRTASGTIVDDLQRRPWGAWDGQVIDRHGLHWLIGFETEPR